MFKTIECRKCGTKNHYDAGTFTTESVEIICLKCRYPNLCAVRDGNLSHENTRIGLAVAEYAGEPVPVEEDDRPSPARKRIRFGLRTKMMLLFLVVPGLIIAGSGSKNLHIVILAATLAIIGLLVTAFSNWYIIRPVAMLERRATEISLGKNLDRSIVAMSEDEIGSLAWAIERLRISVALMLRRFSKKEER